MYQDILLPVDLGDESSWQKALPRAVELCRQGGGNLHLLTVVPDFGMSVVGQYFPEGYEKDVAAKVLAALKTFAAEKVPDEVNVQHIVGEGTVYDVILRIAGDIGADLIITAAGRPDLKEFLLGPNAARVARHADISVLIVR
ncbi:MAG: universal stress protein [Rhodospirillaceae bacterium]|jgi:nucleotide-binding universal stress UspA family protein|nr:universal stress protein [Rhodospirillaceae bacterium]